MLWLRHSDAVLTHSDVLRLWRKVMFAHFAARRNITHAVNITAEGNITCPQGQTSFQNKNALRTKCVFVLVETDGFEPSTPCMSSMYSNQLSYASKRKTLYHSLLKNAIAFLKRIKKFHSFVNKAKKMHE